MSHELFGPQGLQCCVSAVGRSVPSILGWRLRCAVQRWSCGGLGQCGLRRVRASDWAENCWTWDGKKDKLEENLGIWRWIFRKEHGNQTLKTMFFLVFKWQKLLIIVQTIFGVVLLNLCYQLQKNPANHKQSAWNIGIRHPPSYHSSSLYYCGYGTILYHTIIPVVPARGGAEVALWIYKTFLIYRTCMRRAPAKPVRACILRKWCPVSHVTFEAPLRTSHFSLHSSHSTLHLIWALLTYPSSSLLISSLLISKLSCITSQYYY